MTQVVHRVKTLQHQKFTGAGSRFKFPVHVEHYSLLLGVAIGGFTG
jgi:hypothetical protein